MSDIGCQISALRDLRSGMRWKGKTAALDKSITGFEREAVPQLAGWPLHIVGRRPQERAGLAPFQRQSHAANGVDHNASAVWRILDGKRISSSMGAPP